MKKYLLEFSDMPKVSMGESMHMPRIVNRQANRANPLAISPLQFFRRSDFLPFVETAKESMGNSAKYFALSLLSS